MRIVHMAPSGSNIAALPIWDDSAVGEDRVGSLASTLQLGAVPGQPVNLMVVIENVANFGDSAAETSLAELIKSIGTSAFIVGESESSSWSNAWTLSQPFKASRRGIVLWPNGMDTDSLLNTPIGTVRRTVFPPGRGILVERGKGVWLQLAQPGI